MNNNPYQKMAQQFMDMWQGQSRSMMQDERFVSAMLDIMGNMQQSQGEAAAPTQERHDPNHAPAPDVAAAADAGDGELGYLTRRVERLEARIGQLEALLERAAAGGAS